jgi:hypothetical protein
MIVNMQNDVRTGRGLANSAIGLALAALSVGCAATDSRLVACPLSIEQQQQAVLEIVPRGTYRAEAERRLRAAGIEYSPGQRNSIYYLGLWNRADGTRWHIDVALLFDQDGKLYQTRQADSATERLTPQSPAQSRQQGFVTRPDGGTVRYDPDRIQDGDEFQVPFPEQLDSVKPRR